MKFLIFSKAHMQGGNALWWRPNDCGYTDDLKQAGEYGEERARIIQSYSHGDNIAVPVNIAKSLTTRTTVDLGDGDNRKKLLELLSC